MKKTGTILAVSAAFLALLAPFARSQPEAGFPVPRNRVELESRVKGCLDRIDGRIGIYIKHIESGETLGFRQSELFQLASVFKIPVLLTLYKQISLGKLSLDDRVVLSESMKTFGSGLLPAMKPGLNLSVQDLALLMMARSDNTATDILYHMVGREAIAAYMADLGMTRTTVDYDTRELILAYLGFDPAARLTPAELGRLPESAWTDKARIERQKAFDRSVHNTSTPEEIGALLEKCVKGEIVDGPTSDRIIATLRHHTGAEIITRYLPMAVDVARKGGSLSKDGENTVLLDAAVLRLPREKGTLVLCLFGNDLKGVHYGLKDELGRIARAAYDYFMSGRKS